KKLPDFSGASGSVVFHTTDDTKFTAAQKAAISKVDAGALKLAHVTTVVDPFTTAEQRATQSAQLSAGLAQLRAVQAQLPPGSPDAAAIAAKLKAAQAGSKLLALSSGVRTVSADGTAAIATLNFDRTQQDLPAGAKQAVIDYYRGHPVQGVDVDFSSVIAQTIPEVIGVGEITGVVLAGIVLFVMLGTLVAAGLPILSALIGVGVGVLASLSLSSVVAEQSVTPILGVMLGLAVGIDYSLFIINRHRTQLRQGMELQDSIGLATGTAGNAVVFAGSTVIVALLALNVTGIPFLGVMGTVGAVCILVAVVIAVTFTPAMLRLLGMRVLPKRTRAEVGHDKHVPGPVAPMSTVRAAVTAVLAIVVLLIIAIPALSIRLGLPDASSDPIDSTTHKAFILADQKFGAGVNGPLVVTAHLELPASGRLDEAAVTDRELVIAEKIAELDHVKAVVPVGVSKDSTLAAFEVVPTTGPNSQHTVDLVRELRATTVAGTHGDLGVAGQASGFIDLSDGLGRALPIYLAIVVGLSIIILIGVFRSILVPLIATGGFILSLLATYGVLVAVFQFGWLASVFGIHSTGPVLNFLPIILVGILFGLAMDYQLFLATGMREAYVHGAPAREAVVRGFRAGRRVVIAAAIIMISVFGGFIFSDSVFIVALGLGLASGVLFDAFIVRMLLMPALMHLLGRAAWWLPRWLDRILPQLDVEGAKLEREHQAV
ncbi:MAG TPA: MMPL family transporter, partial [Pseudolysinimonas sp.]|nr:MMPL family transporter [Pseudolysinimonas sp.]